MRVLLTVLLLLTLAFSGCASKGGGDGDDESATASSTATGTSSKPGSGTKSTTSTGTASSSTTGTTAPANKAPIGSLSVVVNGTSVTFKADGSDPDGDAVSFQLGFGDGRSMNGTVLPANVTHTFPAGAYNASLNLTDGKATSRYNASFTVSAVAGAPVTQDFEGGWAVGSVDVPFVLVLAGDCPAAEGLDGIYLALFEIDPGTYGKPYTATVSATSTSDSIVGWEVKFLDDTCQGDGPHVDGSGPITGTVPAGVKYAWMSSDGGADVTGTYHAG